MSLIGGQSLETAKQSVANLELLGRYAALAFCRADVLLQISDNLDIKFCSGPTQTFLNKEDRSLKGRNFLDIIYAEDRDVVKKAISDADTRIDDLMVRTQCDDSRISSVAISGYRVPDFDNDFFLAIKTSPKVQKIYTPAPDRDEESGLLSNESFVDVAADRIREVEAAGGHAKMSMVSIGDLRDAGIEEGSEEEEEVLKAIGDVLNGESLGGDTAGRIDDENFSLVHDESVSESQLAERISNALAKSAPQGRSLMPKVASVDAGSSGMDDQQLAKAMMYSLQEFTRSGEAPEGDLSSAIQRQLERNVEGIEKFRKICRDGTFDLVYMPVCRLSDMSVHHYEALTRFRNTETESPFQLITLAEEVGVISDFDIAVAERAISTVEAALKIGDCTPVAINVSGHSISDPTFCDNLNKLLTAKFGLEEHLSLEITESAEISDLKGVNHAIQEFRRAGFKVALDDFGAGAASFDYLNSFDVDTVKFDGPVVTRAVKTRKGKAFLASMATLCREIGVETIAEMVEDAPLADFLKQSGIELGQGWYFGKPMPQDQAFEGVKNWPSDRPVEETRSLMDRISSGQI